MGPVQEDAAQMSEEEVNAVIDTQIFLRAATNLKSLPAKIVFDLRAHISGGCLVKRSYVFTYFEGQIQSIRGGFSLGALP